MLSNNIKIAVQKKKLVGQIWYRSLDPAKKRRHFLISRDFKYIFRLLIKISTPLPNFKNLQNMQNMLEQKVENRNYEFYQKCLRFTAAN